MFKKTKICSSLMLAFGGGLSMGSLPAFAQEQQLERVEITGSSIRRIDAETALPVQIIRKEEIARSGVTSTEALLQSIAAVSSQGGLNGQTGSGLSTYGQSSVSLRGLGEDRTLVLVNGRRLALFAGGNGGSVNVNAIPLAAIERVEVLKDGASAVYGSDAIAGVVNFILTRDFKGIELAASYGAPTRGAGGQSSKASVVAGFGDIATTGFNATFSLGVEREKAIFGRDRNFSKTGNVPPYLVAGATGQGNLQGAYTPGTGSIATSDWVEGSGQAGFSGGSGTTYGNPVAAAEQCATLAMFEQTLSNGRKRCMFDSAPFANLIPERELVTASANIVFKVSDKLELFGDLLASKSKVKQTIQASPLRASFINDGQDAEFQTQGVDPVLLIRPSNPNYQIAADYLTSIGEGALIGQALGFTARVFDFGPRMQDDSSDQLRIVAGARGTIANQEYEIAAAHNENKVAGKVTAGYFSQVAFVKALNDPTSDYNPWAPIQSAAFKQLLADNNAIYAGKTLGATSKSDSLDGKISGDLFAMGGGAAQYAAGMQTRKENLKLDPSPALLSGDIAGLGGAVVPLDRNRTVNSFFGELNLPLMKTLESNLALRSDDYNDVGQATTYKASASWRPMREVVLRGSTGTGFRAPTLVDLWYPQTIGTSEQLVDPNDPTRTPTQFPLTTGGNPELQPEKSKQFTLGLVLSPVKDFTVGVDWFRIRVEDIISTPSSQEVVSNFRAGDPTYQNLVTLNGDGTVRSIRALTANSGTANVEGLDLEVAYRMNLAEAQRLDLSLSGTYMRKFEQTSPGGVTYQKVGTIVDNSGNPVISTNAVAQDGVILRWKHYLSATYSTGPWAYTLAQNYYRGYRDANDLDDNPHYVPAQALYDAQVAFTGVKGLRLALGAKNLFDKDPPLFIPTSNQFQSGYDTSMYDPRGRFVYVNASYKF